MKRAAFRFGVANADHQVEAYDGRDDIWDVWERARGLTLRGRGTDFWNRYREDIDLAKGLGCTAFRISLSWARLETAPGVWDDEAFAHYRAVTQYIRDAGMVAAVTLLHNVWPLHVQAEGNGEGMLDPHFPKRFARYATEAATRIGDLVDYWVTINEPNQLVFGYFKTFWMRGYSMPPGLDPYTSPARQMVAVLALIPNLFQAHCRARAAIRKLHPEAQVGANPNVFGLPRWLRRLVDRNATTLRTPADAVKQVALLNHPAILGGKADISIAQIAMAQDRINDVVFSEGYLTVHPAALHREGVKPPATFRGWRGRVGVISGTLTAARARSLFVSSAVTYYRNAPAAAQALRDDAVDLVVDDDATLQQYAANGLLLSRLRGSARHYAAAAALGSHALLDAVNEAIRAFGAAHPEAHRHERTATIPPGAAAAAGGALPEAKNDLSLAKVRERGELRVGIHPGVEGLCERVGRHRYRGLEIDLAHAIAAHIFGTDKGRVRFVPVRAAHRLSIARSWLHRLEGIRTSLGLLGTLFGTNWWNLGMAGKLPAFLCPEECVGQLDFVGLDYYWGVSNIWPSELRRLSAASEFRYASAPVWPGGLKNSIDETMEYFPGMPIVIVENGSVADADGFSRADYLEAHINEVEDAVERGAPIDAYVCWSITTNREWGLPLDENSDFGLYHVDLDHDPDLKRVPTPSAQRYKEIIARHAAPPPPPPAAPPEEPAKVLAESAELGDRS